MPRLASPGRQWCEFLPRGYLGAPGLAPHWTGSPSRPARRPSSASLALNSPSSSSQSAAVRIWRWRLNAVGTYGPTTITFTNADAGQGTQTRTATLTVNAPSLQVTSATKRPPRLVLDCSELPFLISRREHAGRTISRMRGRAPARRLVDHVDDIALLDEISAHPLRPSGVPIQLVAVWPPPWIRTSG